MSKYHVDKLMREVILDEGAFQRYRDDRGRYLDGRDLTREERDALMGFDYRALYASGAHPFLLNGFVMRAWPGERSSSQAEYLKAIRDLGYPDFST